MNRKKGIVVGSILVVTIRARPRTGMKLDKLSRASCQGRAMSDFRKSEISL
jgi:hypothetical protein